MFNKKKMNDIFVIDSYTGVDHMVIRKIINLRLTRHPADITRVGYDTTICCPNDLTRNPTSTLMVDFERS